MASKTSFFKTLLVVISFRFIPLLVGARPWAIGGAHLDVRATYTGQTTFQTTTTTTDSSGAIVTETCTINMTPGVVNGEDEVVMVKSCATTGGASTGAAPLPSDTVSSADPGATLSPSPTSSSIAGETTASTDTGSSIMETPTSASPLVTGGPFVILGTSSIPTDSAQRPSSLSSVAASGTTPVSNASPTISPALRPQSSSVLATGTLASRLGTGSDAATATAPLADSSQTPSVNFTPPGRSLSVLPIGLGIFAGVSVLALIVVGWVTYERTKYRKKFRAGKLAEAGGGMGYGGMAPSRV